jgi:hypothetical protein
MTSEIIVGGLTYIDKIFANEIIATNGTFISISTGSLSASSTITGSKLVGDQLCLGARCMTAEQFNHILDMEVADVATSPTGHSGNSNSSGVAAGAPRGLSAETSSGPPIITINGDNPAAIHVGDT